MFDGMIQLAQDEIANYRWLLASIAATIIAVERAVFIAAVRLATHHATVRSMEWFAEAIGAPAEEVLRLHPAMRRFCVDRERVEPERTGELLQILDVDLPPAA